jgi:hypothetical protein
MLENIMAGSIGGIILFFIGLVAWLKRDNDKLKAKHETARVDAKTQSIKAEAKAVEAEQLQAQQRREDAVNASDSNSVASQLDSRFK